MGKVRVENGERDYVAIGTQYARDVVAGIIPACKWVRAACQRQLDDLARKDWRWAWDPGCANRFCAFAELMPHVKGRWRSVNIQLEPWQCFIFTTIFGWVDAEGFRRFRKALIVLPRKNGKSAMASIVGLYGLAMDREPGAEVYAAATTRDQAKVVWDVSRRMALRTPDFCNAYGVSPLAHSIAVESTGSCFKPLSRDADSLEGLNPHFAIIDELHAHSVREVFDVLDEATGSRRQPLMFIISTEGDNPAGVFAEQVDYAQQILDGKHEDDSYFASVYTIDPEDDWTAQSSWTKANPNLGVSIFLDDLAIRCKQAERNSASQASFMMKRLNVRVGAAESYFNMLAWRTICCDPTLRIESFYGRDCWGGLDLASKNDIAAKILLFKHAGSKYAAFGKFYLPEDAIERGKPNYDMYRGWNERGLLTLTPGNIIDFEFIERDLAADMNNFNIVEMGYDPHQATELSTKMRGEGLDMVEITQSVRQLSEPMKDLAGLISMGRIQHDGNPILDWMMGNVAPQFNAREDVFPIKTRPENKIDGALGTIMANSRRMFAEQDTITYSGLRTVG